MIETRLTPIQIINKAEDMGAKKFVGLLSGGKDSIAATHFVANLGKLDSVIFIDTTIGIAETQNFVKEVCEKNGWNLTILQPKMTFEQFVFKYGFPKKATHSWVMRYLKLHPLSHWATQNKDKGIALISGIRQNESKRRMKNSKIFSKEDNMFFVAPLFYMTTQEVWAYLKKNNLEVSPVYNTLHLSGDCLCGAFSDHREAELINIFYPDVAQKIRQLEANCPNKRNKWGNFSSMEGASKQKKLENFICADCTLKS